VDAGPWLIAIQQPKAALDQGDGFGQDQHSMQGPGLASFASNDLP